MRILASTEEYSSQYGLQMYVSFSACFSFSVVYVILGTSFVEHKTIHTSWRVEIHQFQVCISYTLSFKYYFLFLYELIFTFYL